MPARVALTDDERTRSPSRASTRSCMSRARIGPGSWMSTSEIASMIRPRRGCATARALPGDSAARLRLRSRLAHAGCAVQQTLQGYWRVGVVSTKAHSGASAARLPMLRAEHADPPARVSAGHAARQDPVPERRGRRGHIWAARGDRSPAASRPIARAGSSGRIQRTRKRGRGLTGLEAAALPHHVYTAARRHGGA